MQALRSVFGTQFGFRSGVGTADALFLSRRRIEEAIEAKDCSAVLLALGWAKAFDSISPDSLTLALGRFGLADAFVGMVRGIYSNQHTQHFGIFQGCPLSPFLFTIVAAISVGDTTHLLEQRVGPTSAHELLYVDDLYLWAQVEGTCSHTWNVFTPLVRSMVFPLIGASGRC